jgi:hypothetical protein
MRLFLVFQVLRSNSLIAFCIAPVLWHLPETSRKLQDDFGTCRKRLANCRATLARCLILVAVDTFGNN